MSSDIDKIDYKIMRELARNARLSNAELASRVGLSATPCRLRVEKLIEKKYIEGFHAQLNTSKLGNNHITFVEVKLNKTNQSTLDKFNAAVREIPEIEQAYLIAGRFDYLLIIRTPDITAYRHILGDVISNLPEVQSTSTNVSMQAVKEGFGDAHITELE